MTTKERIVEKALLLFNEQGADNVTVRTIAGHLGMSHGNLCYHFASTDVLIERLYDQLVDRLSIGIDAVSTMPALTMGLLRELSKQSFHLLYDYRFLLRDFAGIMRRIPALAERHQALVRRRKEVFRMLVAQMRANGWYRAEPYAGYDEHFLEQLFIIGDFWLSSAEVLYEGPESEKINHYVAVFEAALVPMLTPAGMAAWGRDQ
ncbi:putative transcriptional regulator [Fibrisoma limi BUZ 3]|uniref:Putative transcriptional regulator n=1 Tax=Fibrisoma limi BUZ 3 TaxID=1185876 RepID=I2GCQ8_9BACT|nr:TetR/AcrR family transcriptional regulator [Fibrisoma limi]CCH51682.1 putative transcriptional regulator [Fibrisoma limi BUZ 3]